MGSHRVTYTDRRGRQLDIVVYEDASAYLELRPSDEEMATSVTIPADKREGLARALAGWHSSVVPADRGHATFRVDARCPTCDQAAQPDAADMQEDLHSILHALNLPTAARASSPHEVVEREVVPEIWRLRGQIRRLKVQAAGPVNADVMVADLRAILDALGLGDHTRTHPPHECITRDVLPAIERMKAERAKLGREHDALLDQLHDAEAQAAQPDRPEPVDPASVRVGDYVEVIQQHDDVPLRITVEGEVYQLGRDGDSRHLFYIRGYGGPAIGDVTSVRILHAAEPEPDRGVVQALIAAMEAADRSLGEREQEDWGALAHALIRDHGVHVEVSDA